MVNQLLITLVDSVLGKGKNTSKNNRAYHCPFCKHHKPKLEVNMDTNAKGDNPWHCWVCEAKGKTIKSLFKSVKAPANKVAELNMIIVPGKHEIKQQIDILTLPKEFILLTNIDSLDKVTAL